MAHKGVSDQLSRQGVIPPGVFYFFRCCITFHALFKCSTRGRVVGTLSKVLRKLNQVEQRRAWWEPWTKREVRPEKTSLALRLSEESPRLQLWLKSRKRKIWTSLYNPTHITSHCLQVLRLVGRCFRSPSSCFEWMLFESGPGHGCVADESTPKVIQTIIQIFAPSTYSTPAWHMSALRFFSFTAESLNIASSTGKASNVV